jgi:dCTP deaminase
MSVIPFIRDGKNPTVVETPSAFSLEGQAILIRELDHEQFSSQNDANVSYDLWVGREYRDHRDVGKRDLHEGEEIKLPPGSAVIEEMEEVLQLPRSMFGQIYQKFPFCREGFPIHPLRLIQVIAATY